MTMLVSAIMPTSGRREFAREAVESFRSQDYAHKELVILDDANDPSFPNGAADIELDCPVIYVRHESRSIGEKRNLCVRYSRGNIVAHGDSDDLSAPERLSAQMAVLEESGKAVCGFSSMLFHDLPTDKWARFRCIGASSIGTSLMYRRQWALAHPFREGGKPWGEDNALIAQAYGESQMVTMEGGSLMVARNHPGNTSPKYLDHGHYQYPKIDPSEIPEWYKVRQCA